MRRFLILVPHKFPDDDVVVFPALLFVLSRALCFPLNILCLLAFLVRFSCFLLAYNKKQTNKQAWIRARSDLPEFSLQWLTGLAFSHPELALEALRLGLSEEDDDYDDDDDDADDVYEDEDYGEVVAEHEL